MRLASVVQGGDTVWGLVADEEFIVLTERWPDLQTAMIETPATIAAAGAKSSRRFALSAVERWLPPVIQPKKIFCVGMNYKAHAKEAGGRSASAHPSIFPRFIDSFVGHRQPTLKPRNSDSFDYEAELAVVIGVGGRHIPERRAKHHIGGYTCLSENSVRDFQKHNPQVTPGKNFDSSGAIGPWVTTADAVADAAALRVVGRLNGAIVQSALVEELIFPIAAIIAYISSFTTLAPGDIIATGTPDGVGFLRTPPLYLKRGDVFETDIEGLGTLSNPVEDEAVETSQPPHPAAARLTAAVR